MNEYSNKFDDCTGDREIFSEDELDLNSLDDLQFEIDNMNGRGTLRPPERDAVAELAAFEASMKVLDDLAEDASKPEPAEPQEGEPQCSKTSRTTRRKARLRDRDFVMRTKRYAACGSRGSEGTSLGENTHTPKASPTTASTHTASTHTESTNPGPLDSKHLKRARILDRLFSRYKRTRTPPRWDEASALAKAVFFHREVAKRGGVSFTLNLSPEVENAARADPRSFTEHIKRRLSRHLKSAFGKSVDFWFGLDISPAGRPHLHGGIVVTHNEAEALLRALTRAGGEWGSVRGARHQAHLGARLDDDWGTYATKKISPSRQAEYGSMLCVTDNIRRCTRVSFDDDRANVLASL